jgi:hypothetical protein
MQYNVHPNYNNIRYCIKDKVNLYISFIDTHHPFHEII